MVLLLQSIFMLLHRNGKPLIESLEVICTFVHNLLCLAKSLFFYFSLSFVRFEFGFGFFLDRHFSSTVTSGNINNFLLLVYNCLLLGTLCFKSFLKHGDHFILVVMALLRCSFQGNRCYGDQHFAAAGWAWDADAVISQCFNDHLDLLLHRVSTNPCLFDGTGPWRTCSAFRRHIVTQCNQSRVN